jgi:hypothetical protein
MQAPLLWIQTPFYFNTSKYVETAQIPLPLSSETDNIDNYTGMIDGEIAEIIGFVYKVKERERERGGGEKE